MDWTEDNFKNESRAKLSDLVAIANYRSHEGEFANYRFIGDLKPICTILLPIYKDGKPLWSERMKQNVQVPFYVTNYDYKEGKFIEGKECPFMKAAEFINAHVEKAFRPSEKKLAQAINRTVQEDNSDDKGTFRRKGKPTEKERSTRKKDGPKSECRTPVEVHTIGYQMSQDIRAVIETNKVKIFNRDRTQSKVVKKPPTDPKFGVDVLIKHDESVKGSKKTFVQKGDRTPLTQDEMGLLTWDLDKVVEQLILSPTEAKTEAKRIVDEFKKSLKNGGAKKQDIDENDLPGDIESGGFGDDSGSDTTDFDNDDPFAENTTQKASGNNKNKQQQRRPNKPKDEADELFGDDNGVDLGDGDEGDFPDF